MGKKIIVAVNDLFFAARIRSAAEHLGLSLLSAKNGDQVLDLARRETPELIIFDLNNSRCQPLETIGRLKQEATLAAIRTIGYFSHVQVDLRQQARAAGCDLVLPKSAFTQKLSELLSDHV